MTSPTAAKRVLTESAHLLNQASQASSSIISADVSLQLQNVGRRVRQSVTEGYKTRIEPSIPAPTTTQDDMYIFRSSSDTLHQVYSRELPRFCDSGDAPVYGRFDPEKSARKRRPSDEGSEPQEEDSSAMVTAPPPLESRTIRAAPRRRSGLQKTQSLPVGSLFGKGPSVAPSLQTIPSQSTLVESADTPVDDFEDLFKEDF